MKHFAPGTSAIALITGLAGPVSADDVTAWRLFISDHAAPVVHVLDAPTNEEIAHFDISGPASLYRSKTGAGVYAVQTSANTVSVIKTGITLNDHGDHADIEVEDPALSKAEFTGEYPVHFVEHEGQWAIFFDKEGVARVFEEREALEGHVQTREIATAGPHHGVAIPFGNFDLITTPNATDPSELPDSLLTFGQDGRQIGEPAACPGLHGEAASGNMVAIACADGLLVVRANGMNAPSIEHIAYADGLPEGRVTTLIGGRGLQYFLGNFGADKIVLIDPSEAEAFRLVELPTRRVHFAVDPVRPRFAYVFTEDGGLHQLDVITGEIKNTLALTEPYSMDGHWSDPRPRIAVAGDHVYVSDPLAGKLHVIDGESFAEEGKVAVEGTPFNLVAVGGSGVSHDADEGDQHDHEAHDDHAHSQVHDDQVYKGYFEDDQIAPRTLADWEGDWQSVYPLLQDGTLDPVMEHKAEAGSMTADEYRAYYYVGYETDVERITIKGDTFTFYAKGEPAQARYVEDGYEILTYEKGNRGVRFIFKKVEGDETAPAFVQFSDHAIAPQDAGHFHLYWGEDRAALLDELTNWPTYYPSELSADEVVEEMLAH